jgi:hypothetical protein
MFDDLPIELRNHIMRMRVHAQYQDAINANDRLRYWRDGVLWEAKKTFLVWLCRAHGLRVSGPKRELIKRLREHRRYNLAQKRERSSRFWLGAC